MSVPTYASQAPDVTALIIASEGEFKVVDGNSGVETPNDNNKNTNGKVEDQNGQQNDAHQPGNSVKDSHLLTRVNKLKNVIWQQNSVFKDFKISVLDKEDGRIILQTPLSGHQLLFNVSHNPFHFCVRHDVDRLLWKPIASENNAKIWKHVTTFKASKKNQKFVTCSQKYGFVAIIDCVRNIYVYVTKSISDNQGSQYIIELPTSEEVLGVRASSESLETDWGFIWTDKCRISEIFDNTYLEEHLSRKNLMAKNLKGLKKQFEKEQGNHAKAARLIHNLPRDLSNDESLARANWQPISLLYKRRLLTLMYQIYHGTADKSIAQMFQKKDPEKQSTRNKGQFEVKRYNAKSGRNSFTYKGTMIWNSIQDRIKDAETVQNFKTRLKGVRQTISKLSFQKGLTGFQFTHFGFSVYAC
eukprot:gene20947-22997_t